jgi:hypothetical protein
MKTSKPLAIIIFIGIAWSVMVMVSMHFLNAGYDPIKQTTSEYVNGHYGYLMPTVFLSVSIASLALITGLYITMPSPGLSKAGLALMGIFAVQAIVAMFFPVNLQGTPVTTSGRVHHILGLVGFFCLAIGVILISQSFKKDKNFRPLYKPASIMSWIILAMFFSVFVNLYTKSGFAGISQRILLAALMAWFILIAFRFFAMAENTSTFK